MAQLNIKSEEAYRLAAELAELTGESLTSAVTAALRERLERERLARDKAARVARILGIAEGIRAHLRGPVASADTEAFYDEHGFPA